MRNSGIGKFFRRKILRWSFFILLLWILAETGFPATWQWSVYDLYSELRLRAGIETLPENPVIVGIDEASVQKFGRWPWPRTRLARLIRRIASGNPQIVGLDILLTEKSEEGDEELAEALAALDRPVLINRLGLKARYGLFHRRIVPGSSEEVLPVFKKVAETAYADILPEPDGVVRKIPLYVNIDGEHRYSLAAKIFALTRGSGKFLPEENHPKEGFMSEDLFLTVGRGIDSFTYISAAELLENTTETAFLQNKIVLIGVTLPGLESDRFRTAVKKMGEIPGVYLHAYALTTMLYWGETTRISPFFIMLTALFTGWLAARGGKADMKEISFYLLLPLGLLVVSLTFFFYKIFFPPVIPLLSGWLIRSIVLIRDAYETRIKEKKLRETFAKYLSPEIMEEVMRGPRPELSGVRRKITVLIADLRGFTGFAEGKDPAEVVNTLNRHLSVMTDIIFSYGGTLDKFLGDSVMAFFGAPLSQPDHSHRALGAAVTIIETLSANGWALPVGIGIATGEAMVGNIGGRKRMEYTAIGDTVNIAARLQALAGPGEILATADSFDIETKKMVTEWESVNLRGKQTPVRVGLVKVSKENSIYRE